MSELPRLQVFFDAAHTRSYEFRRAQLLKLKQAILDNEDALHQALKTDLNKSPEESWVTEIGFVLAEIRHTLKHLKLWMKPRRVPTNLLNFPSKSFIYKEPLGVVLIIAPWNYPFQLLMAPLVGAIAAGNCAVLKPSEFAPATSGVIRKIVAGIFPPEYIICREGEGARVIPEMMNTFRFAHVFYTGSTEVGRIIYKMAAEKLIPVTLELGGKSPCIVESDAAIDIAAKRIALTKFSNAGQMCVAPDYVLVHESVKEAFVTEMKRIIPKFFTADASVSKNYGRIINERQFTRLQRYLDEGTILYGGKLDPSTRYLEPTLLDNISVHMAVMGEEIFGPILPILSFSTHKEALDIIRRNPDPLAFYVFTGSREKEQQWLEGVAFGGGCVNNASWHLTNMNLPFGGRGNSGIGAYHGIYSFNVFSHAKSVMKTPTWLDPSIRYPPFEGKLEWFRKIIK